MRVCGLICRCGVNQPKNERTYLYNLAFTRNVHGLAGDIETVTPPHLYHLVHEQFVSCIGPYAPEEEVELWVQGLWCAMLESRPVPSDGADDLQPSLSRRAPKLFASELSRGRIFFRAKVCLARAKR